MSILISTYFVIFVLLLFSNYVQCNNFPILSSGEFNQIKIRDDYTNYIIITHTKLLNPSTQQYSSQFQQYLSQISKNSKNVVYQNDCKSNDILECIQPQRNPVLIMVNRIPVKFRQSFSKQPVKIQDIILWIDSRINKKPHNIVLQQQLESLIQQNQNNLFCLCHNQKKPLQRTSFQALTKNYPFLQFCFISTPHLTQKLGFIPGNFTFYKTSLQDRDDLQYQNRYELWQSVLKSKMIPNMERASHIVSQRFSNQKKNIHVFGISCMFTYQCDNIWKTVVKQKEQLLKKYPDIDFRISFAQSDLAFYLYYHIKIQRQKLPALFHIHLTNINENRQDIGGGKVVRHLRYINQFNSQTIIQFIQDVKNENIEKQYLSAEKPKKNGFTGKGSQKLIQKLTAQTLQQILFTRDKHYVLLISILNLGCTQCDEFYNQYKKVAAFIGTQQITFGFFDVQYNQISLKDVTNVPQVLLYKKGDLNSKPIIMERRARFDSFLQFLRQNIQFENKGQL